VKEKKAARERKGEGGREPRREGEGAWKWGSEVGSLLSPVLAKNVDMFLEIELVCPISFQVRRA